MRYVKINRVIGHVLLLIVFGVALASVSAARADDTRPPDLPPSVCNDLQIPAGNKVAFHAYARGVQIYRWNGIKWVFVAPVAILFADANYIGQIGIHYAGPTWESNSGSSVKAARLIGCSPDATAIDWLKLQLSRDPGNCVVRYIAKVLLPEVQQRQRGGTLRNRVVRDCLVDFCQQIVWNSHRS